MFNRPSRSALKHAASFSMFEMKKHCLGTPCVAFIVSINWQRSVELSKFQVLEAAICRHRANRNPSRGHMSRTGSWGPSTFHLFRRWAEGLWILTRHLMHRLERKYAVDLPMSALCCHCRHGWFLAWPPYYEATHDIADKVTQWINSYITGTSVSVLTDISIATEASLWTVHSVG